MLWYPKYVWKFLGDWLWDWQLFRVESLLMPGYIPKIVYADTASAWLIFPKMKSVCLCFCRLYWLGVHCIYVNGCVFHPASSIQLRRKYFKARTLDYARLCIGKQAKYLTSLLLTSMRRTLMSYAISATVTFGCDIACSDCHRLLSTMPCFEQRWSAASDHHYSTQACPNSGR